MCTIRCLISWFRCTTHFYARLALMVDMCGWCSRTILPWWCARFRTIRCNDRSSVRAGACEQEAMPWLVPDGPSADADYDAYQLLVYLRALSDTDPTWCGDASW